MTIKSILLALLCGVQLAAAAGSLTLEWRANTETNLAGYAVIEGAVSGFSTNGGILRTCPQTKATNYTIPNVTGPGYYAVIAYDDQGFASEPSLEVYWDPIPANPGDLAIQRRLGQTNEITVTWAASDTNLTWRIYSSTQPGAWTATNTATASPYLLATPTIGPVYVGITAVNRAGYESGITRGTWAPIGSPAGVRLYFSLRIEAGIIEAPGR